MRTLGGGCTDFLLAHCWVASATPKPITSLQKLKMLATLVKYHPQSAQSKSLFFSNAGKPVYEMQRGKRIGLATEIFDLGKERAEKAAVALERRHDEGCISFGVERGAKCYVVIVRQDELKVPAIKAWFRKTVLVSNFTIVQAGAV